MHHIQQPRRRPGWAVLAALCLSSFLVIAGLAWADGEDDPTFNGSGTVHVAAHEGTRIATPPVVDQAADGTIVSAVGLNRIPPGRGGGSFSSIDVVRYSAAGAVLRNDVNPTFPLTLEWDDDGTTFDVEALPGGTARVAHAAFPSLGGRANTTAPLLVIMDVSAVGSPTVKQFTAPGECIEGPGSRAAAEGPPQPADADIAPDGTVYAVWNNCDDGKPWLASYVDGALDVARSAGIDGHAEEIVVAPGGDVFLATSGEYSETTPERSFASGGTLVTKHAADGLARDPAYGNVGGAILPSFPLALTVDSQNRAVVWESSTGKGGDDTALLFRFDPDGDLDESWDDDGGTELQHPLIVDPTSCGCGQPAHLVAQTDGKIVLVGPTDEHRDRRGDARDPEWFVARTTVDGDLDPTWDGDGVRPFDLDTGSFGEYLRFVGEPALQADGKLLVPSAPRSVPQVKRIPAPPAEGDSLGLSRIGLTPAAPPPVVEQQQSTAAAPPKPPAQITAATSKAVRTCKSRRSFTIRLRTGRKKADRSPIVSAVVRVNGKKVKVSKGERRTSRVVLEQLPKGRFTVDIRLVLKDGGKVRDTRRYRTCTKKIERELAPLRTTPPRR